jgi:hypothetical protein
LFRLYSEEELPPEFKLFIPTAPAARSDKAKAVDNDNHSLQENVEVLASDENEIGETNNVLTEHDNTEKSSSPSQGDVAVSS